ncbi:MAG: WGR domain-containing protein [Myxococcota bacterium]|nr:WGR domain-containing protein [Myxococcota bacterium]
MKRFELVKGTSSKFWTIERAGKQVTTAWGRIGTTGQAKTKAFASEALAEKEVARLGAEKTRSGYQAVGHPVTAVPPTARSTPKGSLTTLELWALGEALANTTDCKLSGRADFMWSAGDGASIPSRNGQLRLGDAEHHPGSVLLKAAAGRGPNALFSVHATIDGEPTRVVGVRLRRGLPVAWEVQTPLPIKRQKQDNSRGTAGIWTPGLTPKQLTDMPLFLEATGGRALDCSTVDDHMPWLLGLDANGEAVCVVNGRNRALFAAGADPIERPSAAELAALRAQPHRHAIPAADLQAFAAAIRKPAVRRPAKADRSIADGEWVEVKPFSKRLRLAFCTDPDLALPSARGELCFGNFAEPASAIRIKGCAATNLRMRVEHTVFSRSAHGERWAFEQTLHGLRLSEERPVRWQVQGELVPRKRWAHHIEESCHVGCWTPGLERTNPEGFDGKTYPTEHAGGFRWKAKARTPLAWMIGFDAHDRPACVLVAPMSVAWDAGAYRFADYFAPGDAPVTKRGVGAAVRAAKAEALAANELLAAEHPLTPATAAELAAIASAIAAGPTKPTKRITERITERFSLSWDKAAIPAVKGKLRVGDPGGADFALAAGGDGVKQVFAFYDDENEEASAWGRAVLGVRLGAGKAVQWKPSFGMGVDSGKYGVWSPGFPTDDLAEGLHTEGELVAKIQSTAEGDCGFPSLVGLDAAKQPVAFLFGEALRPEVFERAKRPLAS